MRRQIIIAQDNNAPDQQQEMVVWAVQEPGSAPGPIFHGDLQTAANHAVGCRVIVLVPTAMMLLARVPLPAMNRQRLMKAIPFALEEQLAGDIDAMHYALGQRDEDGNQACAVLERDVMEAWLEHLKNFNIQPDLMCAEFYTLPWEEGCWTLLFQDMGRSNETAILRTDAQTGLAIDYANIAPLLRSFYENAPEELRPQRLRIIACRDAARSESDADEQTQLTDSQTDGESYASVLAECQALCQELNISLEEEEHQESWLAVLAPHLDESNCINLLQGEFSRKEQFEKLLRPWRAAAAMLLVWLVLQLGNLIFEYHTLSKKDADLRSQIVAVFKGTFPRSPLSTDLKAQMQSELKRLKGSGNSGINMFEMLAKAGPVLNSTKTATLRGVRFKDDNMNLDIEITDLQALDELKQQLTKQAELQVEIVSASARAGKVESRLQLKPGNKS